MPQDPPDDPTAPSRGPAEGPAFERWVAPFFRDPSLWPVLFVATASFVTLGAAALLLAFAERNLFALGAVLVLALVSVDVALRERRRGRFGLASGCLVGYWILAAASAIVVARSGWF